MLKFKNKYFDFFNKNFNKVILSLIQIETIYVKCNSVFFKIHDEFKYL